MTTIVLLLSQNTNYYFINYIFIYNYLQLLNVHETDCNLIECFLLLLFCFVFLILFLMLFLLFVVVVVYNYL